MNEQFPERRIRKTPVDEERRVTEKVAVLETRVNYHDYRLVQNEDLTKRLIEKLDEHIQTNTERDLEIQRNLANITGAVTSLTETVAETNNTLKSIAQLATRSNAKWIKFDAAWKTIGVIASAASIFIGALWTAGTYFAERAEVATHEQRTGK